MDKKILDAIQDLIKETVWRPLVKELIKSIIKKYAFLSWGFMPFLITTFVMKIADRIFDALDLYFDMENIQLRNKEHENALRLATNTLKIVGSKYGVISDEFKNADMEQKIILSEYAKFNI